MHPYTSDSDSVAQEFAREQRVSPAAAVINRR